MDTADEEPPTDDVFSILRVQRRRHAVRCLRAADGPIDVRHLSDCVVDAESDGREAVDGERRKRVQISLQQNHLPKLADTGFVEYDPRTGTVTPRPTLSACGRHLDIEDGATPDEVAPNDSGSRGSTSRSIGWPLAYLGVAGLAGATAIAASTGVLGSDSAQIAPWIGAFALLAGVLAGADLLSSLRTGD